MSSFYRTQARNRDQQDGFERHLWGSIEYVNGAGAVMKVRGTGTEDEEAPILNVGYSFNVGQNFNTEVMLVSLGSDTNQKYAIPTIPRDKQRQWAEGSGGIQNPVDPERAIQLDDDSIWLKDGKFTLGNDRAVTITVSGSNITISTAGDLDLESANLRHNGVNIGATHVHSQGPDSHGDAEVDTNPPH
jgi:hypothetical protein